MSRYQRILDLSTFPKDKLEHLNKVKVLIIGAGGVGQHVSSYLVTNGVTNLTILDYDKVELSNLNRQILLTEKDISLDKVDVVKKALRERNSESKITSIKLKVTKENIINLIKDFEVVVDAVDNWESKLVISEACKSLHKLSLHVGVDGESGQYCLFKNKHLIDIVPKDILSEKRDGVLGPMVGALSSLASLHLIKYLVGLDNEVDTLFSFDAKTSTLTKIKLW